jgi:hypothetical protein
MNAVVFMLNSKKLNRYLASFYDGWTQTVVTLCCAVERESHSG